MYKRKNGGNRKMYNILHLFRDEKFTTNFVNFINENFKDNYHEIWVYGQHILHVKTELFTSKNVKRVMDINKKLWTKEIYKFDKIIYHGVFDIDIIDFFSRNKKLFSKLYLYFWGGDKFYVHNKKYNLKKKYVINNARGIINILPEERKYIQKFYNPKGKFYCAIYCADFALMKSIKGENVEKDHIAIQLGNSATKSNNHIDILNDLIRFKDENIKLYVPLSYGDMNYAKKVIKEGQKLFGEKFCALTELISYDEYKRFSNSMDIAIFDMNRQQALGNIMALLYFGKKVYLRDRSVLLHYFRESRGCDVFTTNEISRVSFNEFIQFPETSRINNGEMVEELLSLKARIEEWRKIFSE